MARGAFPFTANIRRVFTDAAMQYDVLSGLHREIGRELAKRLKDLNSSDVCRILDVGMGTGWYTNRLKSLFPEAFVVGIDIADGMIQRALEKYEELNIVQADASYLPFKLDTFDVITSNFSYQWVNHLSAGFRLCQRCLKKEGFLCVTMFGYETFRELFSSLQETMKEKDQPLPIRRLANKTAIFSGLKEIGFREIEVDDERIKTRFPDMLALIKWIKDIGANGLYKDVYVGRNWLNRANEYYTQNFSDALGPYATFEVIWIRARK